MRYCGKKAEPVVLIQRLSIELLSGIRKSKRKVISLREIHIPTLKYRKKGAMVPENSYTCKNNAKLGNFSNSDSAKALKTVALRMERK